MPLANALLRAPPAPDAEPRFPLELVFCPRCTLVQITVDVAPEELFCDYAYFSSYSDTMVRHAALLAERTIRERSLDRRSLVVEVASNDGYLLSSYANAGVRVLGIEPARNVARVAIRRGVPTLCEFFGRELAHDLARDGLAADVLHAHNVLAHVPDLHGFLDGIEALLSERGIACIEVPHVRSLVDGCEFDTIYHEHLAYFSLTALVALVARHGLAVASVERIPVHGGSLRVFVGRARSTEPDGSVASLLAEERRWGVGDLATYRGFAERAVRLRDRLAELLHDRSARGAAIAGYGASAKGCILLNWLGAAGQTLRWIADKSPHKQGRLLPGVHTPVVAPERIAGDRPDYLLLLVWNIADEVMAQQRAFAAQGGRFVVPIPTVEVIG